MDYSPSLLEAFPTHPQGGQSSSPGPAWPGSLSTSPQSPLYSCRVGLSVVSLRMPSPFVPQDLCTCCSYCRECLPPSTHSQGSAKALFLERLSLTPAYQLRKVLCEHLPCVLVAFFTCHRLPSYIDLRVRLLPTGFVRAGTRALLVLPRRGPGSSGSSTLRAPWPRPLPANLRDSRAHCTWTASLLGFSLCSETPLT